MEAAGNEGAETERKLLLMKWCGTISKRGKKCGEGRKNVHA